MTKMVSLKQTKKEREERYNIKPGPVGDEYPYDTCLSLNESTLKKLGIDVTKLNVNDKFTITANAYVKSVSSSKGVEYSSDNLRLQMTELSLTEKTSGGAIDALSKGIDDAEDDE